MQENKPVRAASSWERNVNKKVEKNPKAAEKMGQAIKVARTTVRSFNLTAAGIELLSSKLIEVSSQRLEDRERFIFDTLLEEGVNLGEYKYADSTAYSVSPKLFRFSEEHYSPSFFDEEANDVTASVASLTLFKSYAFLSVFEAKKERELSQDPKIVEKYVDKYFNEMIDGANGEEGSEKFIEAAQTARNKVKALDNLKLVGRGMEFVIKSGDQMLFATNFEQEDVISKYITAHLEQDYIKRMKLNVWWYISPDRLPDVAHEFLPAEDAPSQDAVFEITGENSINKVIGLYTSGELVQKLFNSENLQDVEALELKESKTVETKKQKKKKKKAPPPPIQKFKRKPKELETNSTQEFNQEDVEIAPEVVATVSEPVVETGEVEALNIVEEHVEELAAEPENIVEDVLAEVESEVIAEFGDEEASEEDIVDDGILAEPEDLVAEITSDVDSEAQPVRQTVSSSNENTPKKRRNRRGGRRKRAAKEAAIANTQQANRSGVVESSVKPSEPVYEEVKINGKYVWVPVVDRSLRTKSNLVAEEARRNRLAEIERTRKEREEEEKRKIEAEKAAREEENTLAAIAEAARLAAIEEENRRHDEEMEKHKENLIKTFGHLLNENEVVAVDPVELVDEDEDEFVDMHFEETPKRKKRVEEEKFIR